MRQCDLDLRILGTNCLPQAVAKSTADETFLIPPSDQSTYISTLNSLIEKNGIDLIIPDNDREVAATSAHRSDIVTKVFLPDDEVIRICQDKHRFYDALVSAGRKMVPSVNVTDLDSIEEIINELPNTEKYWVRPRRGSGSKGATWVRTAEQARKWISLWVELRGFPVEDFQISSFLPGKDYNVQTIWNNGKLVVAKMAERLSYYMGANRLSGMSSTPEIARTLRDDKALEVITEVIQSLPGVPNGSYNVDMKGDSDNYMYVNEINIGRFPMITTIHDSVGRINTAEAYVKTAFGYPYPKFSPDDMIPGYLLIRELDTEPLVIHESELGQSNWVY